MIQMTSPEGCDGVVTNREFILNTSEYDLLCRMNDMLRKNDARIEGFTYCACIMDCLMPSKKAHERCANGYDLFCHECIAAFLNEKM